MRSRTSIRPQDQPRYAAGPSDEPDFVLGRSRTGPRVGADPRQALGAPPKGILKNTSDESSSGSANHPGAAPNPNAAVALKGIMKAQKGGELGGGRAGARPGGGSYDDSSVGWGGGAKASARSSDAPKSAIFERPQPKRTEAPRSAIFERPKMTDSAPPKQSDKPRSAIFERPKNADSAPAARKSEGPRSAIFERPKNPDLSSNTKASFEEPIHRGAAKGGARDVPRKMSLEEELERATGAPGSKEGQGPRGGGEGRKDAGGGGGKGKRGGGGADEGSQLAKGATMRIVCDEKKNDESLLGKISWMTMGGKKK